MTIAKAGVDGRARELRCRDGRLQELESENGAVLDVRVS
jgi:hypothetical protein